MMVDFDLDALWNGNERIIPGFPSCERSLPCHFGRYQWARQFVRRYDRLIDWGCGVGYGARFIAPTRGHYLGIECNPLAVQYAKETVASGVTVEFWEGDLRTCEATGTIGIAFEIIEHLPDPPTETVKRLLQRTPLLFFSVPYRETPQHNPHHCHANLSEQDFADLDGTFYYQDLAGQVHETPIADIKCLLCRVENENL